MIGPQKAQKSHNHFVRFVPFVANVVAYVFSAECSVSIASEAA